MPIDQYYTEQNNQITFTRQQASDFAKLVADDFNPSLYLQALPECKRFQASLMELISGEPSTVKRLCNIIIHYPDVLETATEEEAR